jgi:hypothetical protein
VTLGYTLALLDSRHEAMVEAAFLTVDTDTGAAPAAGNQRRSPVPNEVSFASGTGLNV